MLERRKRNRVYSEDFKREAVAMYEASDKSLPEICRLLEISSVSVLNRWRMLYGSENSKRVSMKILNSEKKDTICQRDVHQSKPEDVAKIANLEEEIRHLRQVLGTHAVKEYLAKLREESWREVTDAATAKEVERMVAKKR